MRALVGESRSSRGEAALLGSDNRESLAELYRLSSRKRGLALAVSDEAAGRGRTEFRLIGASANNAKKGKKQTKGRPSSANMAYGTRVVNRSQCLFTGEPFE